MGTDTSTDVVNGFVTGLAHGIADALWPLAFIMMGSAIAAPAIGSLLFAGVSNRWSVVRGSSISSVVAGALLTFLSFYLSILSLTVIYRLELFPREWVLILPWLAGLVVLFSIYRHYQWRAALDRARLAGIASCYVLAIGAVLTDMLTR